MYNGAQHLCRRSGASANNGWDLRVLKCGGINTTLAGAYQAQHEIQYLLRTKVSPRFPGARLWAVPVNRRSRVYFSRASHRRTKITGTKAQLELRTPEQTAYITPLTREAD